MPDLELYSFAACPFAQRTRMVLAEKALDVELHEIDVYNKPDGWENISPTGKVPLLRHQDQAVYESTIINEYLDETFPSPALMPAASIDRAIARLWIHYCENTFLPALHGLIRVRKDPAKLADQKRTVIDSMAYMEDNGLRQLSDGPFWFGHSPTLVDFQYWPFIERFGAYEQLYGLTWPDNCTRLGQWRDAMAAQKSVAATVRPVSYHVEQQERLAQRIEAAGS